MRTVYGVSASPFVRKVRVALAEKGLDYQLEPVFPGPQAPPEWRKLSPLGKVPAFRDGDRTLADSSVICAYLERVAPEPPLYPRDPFDYARALWFEEYGDGGLVPVFGGKIFFQRVVGPRFMGHTTDEDVVRNAIENEVPPLLDYLESELTGDYLVGGAFTIGDIGITSQFVNLGYAGVRVDTRRWPRLAAYVDRMKARPSFARLIEEEKAAFGFEG
jgi:glutathione S-transferase